MTKCANFVCIREARGGKSIGTKFCRRCRADNKPYIFECVQCKSTFIGELNNGVLPQTCSVKCRNRRKYYVYGYKWYKLHPQKYKPIPKVVKVCIVCDKAYAGFAKKRRFCSVKCNQSYHREYGKWARLHKVIAQKQYLRDRKPQEVLYVIQG